MRGSFRWGTRATVRWKGLVHGAWTVSQPAREESEKLGQTTGVRPSPRRPSSPGPRSQAVGAEREQKSKEGGNRMGSSPICVREACDGNERP